MAKGIYCVINLLIIECIFNFLSQWTRKNQLLLLATATIRPERAFEQIKNMKERKITLRSVYLCCDRATAAAAVRIKEEERKTQKIFHLWYVA